MCSAITALIQCTNPWVGFWPCTLPGTGMVPPIPLKPVAAQDVVVVVVAVLLVVITLLLSDVIDESQLFLNPLASLNSSDDWLLLTDDKLWLIIELLLLLLFTFTSFDQLNDAFWNYHKNRKRENETLVNDRIAIVLFKLNLKLFKSEKKTRKNQPNLINVVFIIWVQFICCCWIIVGRGSGWRNTREK